MTRESDSRLGCQDVVLCDRLFCRDNLHEAQSSQRTSVRTEIGK